MLRFTGRNSRAGKAGPVVLRTDKGIALEYAAQNGDLAIVNELLEKAGAQISKEDKDAALRIAAERGHAAVLNAFLTQVQISDADKVLVVRLAAQNGHYETIHRLLESPSVRAAIHKSTSNPELNALIKEHPLPVRLNLICLIEQAATRGNIQKVNSLLENPIVLENITNDDNHILKLAAENGHVEIVRKLLTLKVVHAEVSSGNFGALRAAQRKGRRAVVNLFREFPGAKELMSSLAFIALDPENSMSALTEGQSQALGALKTERYPARLKGEGEKNTLDNLKNFLIAQYQADPVMYQGQGLPLEFDSQYPDEVQALYHQHPIHAAYRYLFGKPNRWLSSTTRVVHRQEDGQGTAWILPEEMTTIAALWLFVTDESIVLTKSYTKESIRELFVNQLSLAARAHNWDLPEDAPESTPEKDNGEKDSPTCAVGLRLRLSQCLDILISDIGMPEMRDLSPAMMKQYFKDWLVTEGDGERLFKSIDELSLEQLAQLDNAVENFSVIAMGDYASLEKADLDILRILSIQSKTIETFITQCKSFYGASRLVREGMDLSLSNKVFASYEALIRSMAAEPLVFFGSEIGDRIKSRIKVRLAEEEAEQARIAELIAAQHVVAPSAQRRKRQIGNLPSGAKKSEEASDKPVAQKVKRRCCRFW